MSLPKAVKIKKNGVEYISNVNRLEYTLTELIRAALRDTGKFICNRTRQKIRRRTGRSRRFIQYWVRTKQPTPNLQVGFKPGGFYGAFLETGIDTIAKETIVKPKKSNNKTHIRRKHPLKIKKVEALTSATENNISQIREIQAQYLSALGTERGERIINEKEYEGE